FLFVRFHFRTEISRRKQRSPKSPPKKNNCFCPISLLNTVLDSSRYFPTKIQKYEKSPLQNWLLAPKIPAKKKLLSDFTCEYSSGQLIRFPDEKMFLLLLLLPLLPLLLFLHLIKAAGPSQLT